MPRYTTQSPVVQQRIADHKGFRTHGSFWATTDRAEVNAGRLPEEVAKKFRQEHGDGVIDYYVMSYGTPIAWVHCDGTRVVPDVKYSLTTTQHQSIVRRAWGM